MEFSNFDMKMFNQARLEAEKSEFEHFKIGAVITYKNKIIGRGCNDEKTHPMQQRYNKRYRHFHARNGEFIKHSIHAEVAALVSVSYVTGTNVDWSKAKIYVYRICHGKKFGYGISKPCPACLHAIEDMGIKQIYYTDDFGYSYLKLDQ